MKLTINDARKQAEDRIGRALTEKEFGDALAYAKMKAAAQGNGPEYVPLLLPDVIVEQAFQNFTWELARAKKELEEARSPWKQERITASLIAKARQAIPEELMQYVSAADLQSLVMEMA